ncbi:MAG: tetratricopeptide repeat protein [Pseudomonadota bacterium]
MCASRLVLLLGALAWGLTDAPSAVAKPDHTAPDICVSESASLHSLTGAVVNSGDVEDALHGLERGCDPAATLTWLETAASSGSAPASYALGLLYEEGRHVSPDLSAATRHYRRAAVKGHLDSQHHLGMLLLGETKPVSEIEEALYWLGSAVNQGDGMSAAVIALLHVYGMRGVDADPCMAMTWLEVSEMMGAPIALDSLRAQARAMATNRC